MIKTMKRYVRCSTELWGVNLDNYTDVLNGNMTIKDIFDITTIKGGMLRPFLSFGTSFGWNDSRAFPEVWINQSESYTGFVRELEDICKRCRTADKADRYMDTILNTRFPVHAQIDEVRTNYASLELCSTMFDYTIDDDRFSVFILLTLGSPYFD